MVNPAFPSLQLVGVFSLELARLYGYLYQQSGKQFVILHALDGYDEISLTGDFKMITNRGERIIRPQDLGLPTIQPEDIYGGNTIEESARIFVSILKGQGSDAQNAVVAANAGMAIHCSKPDSDLRTCVEQARESLDSGKALNAFKKLVDRPLKIST
jgi:anthranilate phosphoribosyltransferase